MPRPRRNNLLKPQRCLAVAMWGYCHALCAQPVFNMDLLEKNNNLPQVDLRAFNQSDAQPEGRYRVRWQVNNLILATQKAFQFHHNQRGELVPCLSREDLLQAGANAAALAQVPESDAADTCLDPAVVLPGSRLDFDFSHQQLALTIPQALMNREARDAIPVGEWDEGISALQLNYRYTGARQWEQERPGSENDNYLALKSGLNAGPWRLRSEGCLTQNNGQHARWKSASSWLERDIIRWRSELTLGDAYTSGDVFDAVQIEGVGLASDDAMLPDSQKGFAPTIHGIAKSNAQVTVRQNGYILWQTYVTPGPFVIDDLYPTANSGDLEVSVKESDGEVRSFTQPYASVAQMQREGHLKFNLAAGRYRASNGDGQPWLAQFSLMRGLARNITLFGGAQIAGQYRNTTVGVGKGLGNWGALSLQLARAMRNRDQRRQRGLAWQGQYAKSIGQRGTVLTVNGWRYSRARYYSLADAFAWRRADNDDDPTTEQKKSTLQVMLNQAIAGDLSLYVSLNESDYWSGSGRQRTANMGISGQIRGIVWTLSYSDSHSSEQSGNDKTLALSASIPFAHFLAGSYASYSFASSRQNGVARTVGLNGTLLADHSLSYSMEQSGGGQNGDSGDLSLGYSGSRGDVNASYSQDSKQRRLSYGASGGILIHRHGVVLSPEMNGAVVLVDAGGASGVALANQNDIRTNAAGYAVLPFAATWRRNDIALDSRSLPADVELADSTVTTVPTRDAVVLARFKTRVGYKALFTLQANGKPLPFGATVALAGDGDDAQSSIVANDGQLYIAGLPRKGRLLAQWGPAADQHCSSRYDLSSALRQKVRPFIIRKSLTCSFIQ